MAEKISSLDEGYVTGSLSVYPEALDSTDELFIATNNGDTTLKQSLNFTGKTIIVHDASNFPEKGLLRIGPPPGEPGMHEIVYYGERTNSTFTDLLRGFALTRQNRWQIGSHVIHGVMATHHNALKDAILNIEGNLGVQEQPADSSLNDILKELEEIWLAPRPIFRSFPLAGPPPLKVRFQNFTLGHALRFLWDFGDGTQSSERSPTHTYFNEGIYTVRLDIITDIGGTGIVTKRNYITVSEEEIEPFFYVLPKDETPKAYSVETAIELGVSPTIFEFVDQTDGDISQRFWVFDDGERETATDPNIHATEHVYQSPGEYEPSLLVVFANALQKRAVLTDKLIVF
jgi:PKD repeat protein